MQPAQTELSPQASSAPADVQLMAVDPAYIGQFCRVPRVAGLIDEIERRHGGEITLRAIIEQVVHKRWVLWAAVENGSHVLAIAASEAYIDPGGMKRGRVIFATGDDAKRWVHLFAGIEDWARQEGAKKFDIIARKGWARHLPDYRMTHIVLEKVL